MLESWSLRTRLISSYVVLAFVIASAFAAAALFAIDSVEEELIDQRLARTAQHLAQRMTTGQTLDLPPSVTLYRGDALPAPLRGLGPGRHELSLGGAQVNVLVSGEAGQFFVLTDADADFEATKRQFQEFLIAALAGCLGMAVLVGRSAANRVIAPLTVLADAVVTAPQPDRFPSLHSNDELGVLARAFASRTRELQQLVMREQWFVADVSHELRTPLTVIMGAAELLQGLEDVHGDVAELAERIRRTAADTAARVAALLLLSREPRSVNAPLIALELLIRREVERCRPLLSGKDVELGFEAVADVQLRASAELVSTAVGNLITNACLYTEKGTISVLLESHRLVVQDTGVGIPVGIREQVFERFVRADTQRSEGSGLGLAIVRRIAAYLGWQVALEDAPGHGSRFTLAWPPASD